MRFTAVFATLAAFIATSSVLAAPIPQACTLPTEEAVVVADPPAPAPATGGGSGLFPPTPYSTVQISDGVAGNAEAEANSVCVAPFDGVDLATIDDESIDNLAILRKAAEDAESDFNDAIDAGGADEDALEVGKTKNKVLKLTCLLQVRLIRQAQGQDVTAQIADSRGKLANNIAKDVGQAGAASKGIPNSQAALAAEASGST